MGAGNFLEMGEDGKLVGHVEPLAHAMILADSGDPAAAVEVERLSLEVDHVSEIDTARELAAFLKASEGMFAGYDTARQAAIANEAAAAGHTAIDGAIQAS